MAAMASKHNTVVKIERNRGRVLAAEVAGPAKGAAR
jgi:hypothetical protein